MNARVDPAGLAAAPASRDPDADLIVLCRRAAKAIEAYRAAETAATEALDRFDAEKPPYPKLAWRYSAAEDSSARLRELLEEKGAAADASWRKGMRVQIAAVRPWERACRALRSSIGLDRADRRAGAAFDEMDALFRTIAERTSATMFGASWKALVATQWLAAAGDAAWRLGEDLIQSILFDVRQLGTGGTNGGRVRRIERVERPAAP